MDKTIQNGYILLADISGFDAYITKVELNHAKGVVKELLELIVEALTPPMSLASLEGDGVLTFSKDKKALRGEKLLELVELTYAGFRDRLDSIHRNNSCDCLACRDAPSLDLKFFLHYAEYSVQPVDGGGLELGGLGAKLVRERLLKDQVELVNGHEAYVLFTQQSLDRMGLQQEGMDENFSSYPFLGEIRTLRLDLRSRHEEMVETRRTSISGDDATFSVTHDFDVQPSILWSWLNDPEKRSLWMKWRTWSAGLRPRGRIGIGAENHCAHGLGTMIETVLEWIPHKKFTVQSRQDSIKFSMLQTFVLEPLSNDSGTRLHVHTDVQKSGPFRVTHTLLHKGLERLLRMDYQRLAQMSAAGDVQFGESVITP